MPPVIDRLVTLPDGRRLGVAEYGDPHGMPVLAFHGLPGSRRQRHPDDTIAATLGARMLHIDRPGVGRSDPQRGRTLAGWAADMRSLCDTLALDRIRIVGVSAGGPYALACSALLSERVMRTAVVSGVAPREAVPPGSLPFLIRVALAIAPRARWSVRPVALLVGLVARRAPRRYLDALAARLNRSDQRILARPEVRAMLVEDLREAFAQSSAAFTQDLSIIAARWPFDVAHIRTPLALWHGDEDRIVPAAGSEAVARSVPHADLHIVPRAGHFFVLEQWREILTWIMS